MALCLRHETCATVAAVFAAAIPAATLAVYHTVQLTEMFREQPDLASCVIEAAFRASREDKIDFFQRDMLAHAMVLFGMQLAVANCLPERLPAAAQEGLCTKLSSASRHCSLLVSAMKEVEGRAALPGFDPAMMPYLSSVACMAASAAPIFAFADQLQQQTATPASLPYLAGPANTAWLFAVGRALVTAGWVLRLVPAWRAHPTEASPPSSKLLLQLMGFVQPLGRIQRLLSAMLDQLEQGQPAPPAAATVPSTTAIEDVLKGIRMILQAYQPLTDQSMHAAMHGVLAAVRSSSPQLNAAFEALTAACAQGGLPAVLQAVGASLCAAFPQRFACNNPTCGSVEGLTEAACAVKKCSGCKVGMVGMCGSILTLRCCGVACCGVLWNSTADSCWACTSWVVCVCMHGDRPGNSFSTRVFGPAVSALEGLLACLPLLACAQLPHGD